MQPNVVVPSGAECRLENATVNGNVWVQENAGLIVAGSTINGNIRGHSARFWGLTDDDDSSATTVVNGNVEFVDTQSSPLGSTRTEQPATHNFVCDRTRIRGNFSVRASRPDAPVLFGSSTQPMTVGVMVAECADDGSDEGNMVDQNYEAIANEGEVRQRDNTAGNAFNVIANQGTGGKDVFNNTAGGDLLCLDNVPAPASGGNADGRPEDHPEEQCQG
ncbi:MAG: hypothetical protein M3323_10170 [Actinomycetota bacterium]|nr:hypothetical protein [Actinomycetota bacterium]